MSLHPRVAAASARRRRMRDFPEEVWRNLLSYLADVSFWRRIRVPDVGAGGRAEEAASPDRRFGLWCGAAVDAYSLHA